ncbi:putative ATP-dependent hydrolase protein [Roseibium sp. TrichSKD4]|uniref:AAA family ATPase n=1 Tax=Roseibium sp. TrichSKD4 TaxID=744980 RepID=UPI0001E56C63|nr:AAA family ATPase [Roseibium sp. TrichSKD4]EFO30181.1 putative ATP-dependent hydrolase protein [Roseibium sp. TrichSKD4]
MKRSTLTQNAKNSVGTLVARMAVRKALRPFPELRHRSAYIIGAKLPNDTDTDTYEDALAQEFRWEISDGWTRNDLPNFHYFIEEEATTKYRRKAPFEAYSLARDVAEHQRLIGVDTPDHPMSAAFRSVAEAIIEIQPDTKHIVAAVLLARGFSITEKQAEELRSDKLANLTTAFRGDRSLAKALQLLEALREAEASDTTIVEGTSKVASLQNMAGYGAARTWGLELARDLRDWKRKKLSWGDVDRGVLLVGKPGTGKTVYARALAETCGAHFVECSLSKMQGLGHLGDMLKGIGRAFQEARNNSPAILFIDEFDAVGNRATLSSHAPEYATQVITGLLQLMDGTEKRDGVVVVAACNSLETIDPAFLRPGRLERVIEIPLPDLDARKAIFRQHFGAELQDTVLSEVGRLTDGMSGADLEQLARGCRRHSRRSVSGLNELDVLETLNDKFRKVPDAELQRYAVHEAGHVVAANLIYGAIADEVSIRTHFPADNIRFVNSGGTTVLPIRIKLCQIKDDYLNEISLAFAGHAAEKLVLGCASDGSGLASGSDLQKATVLAATLVASSGLSGALAYRAEATGKDMLKLVRNDRHFKSDCDRILHDQMVRIEALLAQNLSLLERVSTKLLKKKNLTSHDLKKILTPDERDRT